MSGLDVDGQIEDSAAPMPAPRLGGRRGLALRDARVHMAVAERFGYLVRSSEQLSWIKDAQSRFVLASPRLASSLGISAEILEGRPDSDFLSLRECAQIRAAERRAVLERRPITARVVHDDCSHWEHLILPLCDELGEVVAVFGIAREESQPGAAPAEGRASSPLIARVAGRTVMLPLDSIHWLDAFGNCVRIHAVDGVYRVRETFERMERRLDPGRFVRIHRSTIVPIGRVRELLTRRSGDYVVVTDLGQRLAVGRSFRQRVRQLVGREIAARASPR